MIYGQIKKDIGQILRKLCEQKGVEIIEAEACPDHIHMLISIPPKFSVAEVMGYLKGKSSLKKYIFAFLMGRFRTSNTITNTVPAVSLSKVYPVCSGL